MIKPGMVLADFSDDAVCTRIAKQARPVLNKWTEQPFDTAVVRCYRITKGACLFITKNEVVGTTWRVEFYQTIDARLLSPIVNKDVKLWKALVNNFDEDWMILKLTIY